MPDFDRHCLACPRLASHLSRIRDMYPRYFARPVPPFGDPKARLLVVGLAPGMHGANRTGRPFTGDHAGILLYETLYRLGVSHQAGGVRAGARLRLAARACSPPPIAAATTPSPVASPPPCSKRSCARPGATWTDRDPGRQAAGGLAA